MIIGNACELSALRADFTSPFLSAPEYNDGSVCLSRLHCCTRQAYCGHSQFQP
jgi:hypothetical protein